MFIDMNISGSQLKLTSKKCDMLLTQSRHRSGSVLVVVVAVKRVVVAVVDVVHVFAVLHSLVAAARAVLVLGNCVLGDVMLGVGGFILDGCGTHVIVLSTVTSLVSCSAVRLLGVGEPLRDHRAHVCVGHAVHHLLAIPM